MTTDSDSAVSGGICITFDQNENISFAIYFCPCKVYIYIYTYIYYIIDLYIYIYIYVLTWNVKFILTIQGDIFLKSGIFRIIYM